MFNYLSHILVLLMAIYCIIFVGDVTEFMFTMARATVKRSTVCRPNITA